MQGDQLPPTMRVPMSIAFPMDPSCGDESKVEQILYCNTGAPNPASASKALGSS